MTPTFNLIDSPFIPCIRQGKLVEVGLKEAMLQSHEFDELRDGSPLVTMALHRLLLAFLHRSLRGPESKESWAKLWKAGQFPANPITAYLEEWRDRLDLFHPKWPFYQDAQFMGKVPKEKKQTGKEPQKKKAEAKKLTEKKPKKTPREVRKGINSLVRQFASGENARLFDHSSDKAPPRLPASRVARELISSQLFAISEGKSDIAHTLDGNIARGITILLTGRSLFETLMLNLIPYGKHFSKTFSSDYEEDSPAWEREFRPSKDQHDLRGYVDYLTWQNRTIKLFPEADGTVQYLFLASGRMMTKEIVYYDPMTSYSATDKKSQLLPGQLNEEKDLWRDSASLLQHDQEQKARQVVSFGWLNTLYKSEVLSCNKDFFKFSAIGVCTKSGQAKVNFWRHDVLPLPYQYLQDIDLVAVLKNSISMADDVGKSLRSSVAKFASRLPSDKKRQKDIVKSVGADALYWSRLEARFRQFLIDLPGTLDEQQDQLRGWYWFLEDTAKASFREALRESPYRSRGQKAVEEAYKQLLISLSISRKKQNIPAREKETP
jgi:CRISPR system Cascade subunit CasA